mgnify:CR=1 FL=1
MLTVSPAEWFGAVWADWHTLIRVVLILLAALLGRWLLLLSVKRVVATVVDGAGRSGHRSIPIDISPLARERVVQRTKTIGSVLNNFITWSVAVVAISMVLSELGVAIGALAAGAGLLGAGVGFGAQALIRDLISGLFIVFEDQYGVGDSVNLGEISGVVEAVGLRVTQVRDLDGVLWYVRNGEIVRVGNHSQGWSRALLDVAFPYSTDVAKATEVVRKAAAQVAEDHTAKVIGAPEVWGIHALSGDQLVLRVVQHVPAGGADEVARELRVAIKQALDANGLELATSHVIQQSSNKN